MVKAALLLLRVYLVVMLALIAIKFVQVFSASKPKNRGTSAPTAPAEIAPQEAGSPAKSTGR